MSAAPVQRSTRKFSLEVANGPLKGQKFQFFKPSIFIGRGAENDLALAFDQKASRAHVEIRVGAQGFSVHNISEKNPVFVNGQNIRNTVIENQAKIQVGDTELIFRAEDIGQGAALKAAPAYVPLGYSPQQHQQQAPMSRSAPMGAVGGAPKQGSKVIFYSVILIIAGAVALATAGGAKKKAPVEIRNTEDLEKDVGKSVDSVTELEKQMEAQGKNSTQYELAQAHYVRGFRDYRQGQYARAVQSLQAAISFYPNHELARRYLSLAKKKLDEMVQSEMALGLKYKGQGNFRMCVGTYEKVLRLINGDTNDLSFNEATQYKRECELQQRDHY